MKKHRSSILLIFIFFIGLSLLLYPSFSDWWNSLRQTEIIDSYASQVANMNDDRYEEIWDSAYQYNASLLKRSNSYILSESKRADYEKLLDVSGLGVMGYIEIPSIDVTLPVYHGTGENVLQVGIGHLEWTSLPVGGESSHCVLSGHRGLPSAKLFTDLDKMVVGDTFSLRILDEVLTYEVDRILVVEPENTEALMIAEGKDLCTLVTCTPYGINTHRLLIRGHRVETEQEHAIRITADATQIEPIVVAPLVACPLLMLLLLVLMIPKRNHHGGVENEETDLFDIADVDLDAFFHDDYFGTGST